MHELLGPILFIRDTSPANQIFGFAFCILLGAGILLPIVRPRTGSFVIALAAALAWYFLGVIGAGIDC